MTAAEMLASDFATLPDLIRAHAAERGDRIALAEADGELDYASLDALIDRVAAALQRDGVQKGDAVAIVATQRASIMRRFFSVRCAPDAWRRRSRLPARRKVSSG